MKMTPEELAAHEGYQRNLAKGRAWAREHRKEARERRLKRLANETPDEREARLARGRARYRAKKAEQDGS